MTRRELVASLIAFTVIVVFIDSIIVFEFVRKGFSWFGAVGLGFTIVILLSAYRSYLGELLRRKKVGEDTKGKRTDRQA